MMHYLPWLSVRKVKWVGLFCIQKDDETVYLTLGAVLNVVTHQSHITRRINTSEQLKWIVSSIINTLNYVKQN